MPDSRPEAADRDLVELALANCAREAIHQIGSIQPTGILIALDEADFLIRTVSANLSVLFPTTPDRAIGQPVAALIGEEAAARLRELAVNREWPGAMIWALPVPRSGQVDRLDAQVFRSEGLIVIEIELERPDSGDVFHELFTPIRDALWKLEGEADFRRYTDSVVEKVRLLTGYDRVMMYRLDSNWDGEVIAESKSPEVGSYLGNHFPASDIPPQARELYTKNLVRLIADIDAAPVPLVGDCNPHTGQPVTLVHSWLRSMSPVHVEYLRNMGVRASMSISLVQNGRLWGLIACHSYAPRYVSLRARELNEFIGRVVSLKLINMDNAERAALHSNIRELLYALTERIRRSGDPGMVIHAFQADFLGLVRAGGAVIAIDGKRLTLGEVPVGPAIDRLLEVLRALPPAPVLSTDHLAELIPIEDAEREVASGMMVAPLDHVMRDFVMWFRPGIIRTLRWAGRPEKILVDGADGPRMSPRKSFDTWIETYRDKSEAWSPAEVDAANALSMALVEALTHRALESSEESYRLLAENSTDLIARLDLERRFVFVSPASRELLGAEPRELVARSVEECIVGEDVEIFRRVFADLDLTGTQQTMLVRCARRDGKIIWVEAKLKRVPCVGGDDEVVVNARDVTQRHTYQLAIEELHRRNARILDSAGEGLVSLDAAGYVSYVNDVAARFLGRAAEAMVGKFCCDVLCSSHNDSCPDAASCPFLQTLRDGETRQGVHPLMNWGKDQLLDLGYVCTPLMDGNAITGCVVVLNEMSARVQAGQVPTEVVFDQATEAVMVTDAGGRITTVNRAFTDITGYSPEEVIGKSPRILRSGVHTPQFYTELWRSLAEQHRWAGEIWNRRKNGEVYPQWGSITAVLDGDGVVRSYVSVFSDISKAKQAEEKLYYLANHDILTGLPNRMRFSEQLGKAIDMAKRNGSKLAVAFMDLDRFKIINDTLGHSVGDSYLKRISERLAAATRRQDTLARWGGDEFVVMLDSITDRNAIAEAVHRLLVCVAEPLMLEGHELVPTASVGISVFPDDGTLPGDLVKAADAAMYRAKAQGRNCFEFFDERMREELDVKFSLASEVRRGLLGGEFLVYYQPQVDAASSRLVGVEALVRWQHPQQGLLPPAQFIPMAEELGLIGELGEWVLRESCRQLREWRDHQVPVPRVAINVSPAQIKESFVEVVAHAIREVGIPPGCVELEITEGALEVGEVARATTRQLRDLGVLLSVDDFGTGYSSLSHIKLFPVTCFKIDKSFIDGVPGNKDDVAIVNTILALGTSLHVDVVAEGVETAEQADFLRAAGVTNIQGFFYGRPMPPEAIVAFCKGYAAHE